MPNWCSTTVKFFGEKKNLEELYKMLKSMDDILDSIKKNPVFEERDPTPGWEGLLVLLCGEQADTTFLKTG